MALRILFMLLWFITINIDKNKFFFNYYRRYRQHNLLEHHHLLKNQADCCFSQTPSSLIFSNSDIVGKCPNIIRTCCIPRTPSSPLQLLRCCRRSVSITTVAATMPPVKQRRVAAHSPVRTYGVSNVPTLKNLPTMLLKPNTSSPMGSSLTGDDVSPATLTTVLVHPILVLNTGQTLSTSALWINTTFTLFTLRTPSSHQNKADCCI